MKIINCDNEEVLKKHLRERNKQFLDECANETIKDKEIMRLL